jgi:hypothetical protein
MFDIIEILKILAVERPVFHSEADFQHALAWKIHQQNPDSKIRLEFKPANLKERAYIDLWVITDNRAFAIELKYKTRGINVKISEESFDLLNQSAQDHGRYDFIKDICRLERVANNHSNVSGYAIFLTNDSAYWKQPKNAQTVDASFRIHQGRTISGNLGWGAGASEGTKLKREENIKLANAYQLSWSDYSHPAQVTYGGFKYLMVQIKPPQKGQ